MTRIAIKLMLVRANGVLKMKKADLTCSDVGVVGDSTGASGETGWLQICSEAAEETDCVHGEIILSGMGDSTLSSAFTEGETLYGQKRKTFLFNEYSLLVT